MRSEQPEQNSRPSSRFGLYVHVPFCLRKCGYCGFFSFSPRRGDRRRFLQALAEEITLASQHVPAGTIRVTSIFFGGGTPTVLAAQELIMILKRLRDSFPCAGSPEISLETNPASVSARDLLQLRSAGFNRLSIGVQSFDDRELQAIGRMHDRAQALETFRLAREAGFANINLDLMYGLPGQTSQQWRQSLYQALDLGPEHLSLYELTLEPATPLHRQAESKRLCLPAEAAVLEMMENTEQILAKTGLHRYEISNYAREGFACSHNINYWENGEYFGFGPAATSYLAGKRWTSTADFSRYCDSALQGWPARDFEEELAREAAFRETVVMGLRMIQGIDCTRLYQRFGIDCLSYYRDILSGLLKDGLLLLEKDRLRLTARGLRLANQVMAALV